MHITVQSHFSLPLYILDHLLGVVDGWVQKLIRELPFTIQVAPQQAAPVVTVHHAVRIQHRDHLEHKMFP